MAAYANRNKVDLVDTALVKARAFILSTTDSGKKSMHATQLSLPSLPTAPGCIFPNQLFGGIELSSRYNV